MCIDMSGRGRGREYDSSCCFFKMPRSLSICPGEADMFSDLQHHNYHDVIKALILRAVFIKMVFRVQFEGGCGESWCMAYLCVHSEGADVKWSRYEGDGL